jgi:hypothetical protein
MGFSFLHGGRNFKERRVGEHGFVVLEEENKVGVVTGEAIPHGLESVLVNVLGEDSVRRPSFSSGFFLT